MNWIELKAADGHSLQAYCSAPAQPRAAIVVLQEIFGVNLHIQALCERYADQGFLAIAPALFDRVAPSQVMGYDAAGISRGREVKAQLNDEQALLDVQAAVNFASKNGLSVGVIGFCWGGTLAWLSAARLTGLSASIVYYGTNVAGYLDQAPRVPVLLHFGEQDMHIPPEHVDRIAATWPGLELHRYPAGHGFNCDDRPAFHAPSAEMAGERTDDFLKRTILC